MSVVQKTHLPIRAVCGDECDKLAWGVRGGNGVCEHGKRMDKRRIVMQNGEKLKGEEMKRLVISCCSACHSNFLPIMLCLLNSKKVMVFIEHVKLY